ncbi:hypothetical protein [uncultured Dokdonia sp.]|uniref:hypothetical protein n=1 Tax=uncultured Dokdonia sp. TaxID=575653 RepID=UPI0026316711|nr:hypothetical protein [uncultured Dokdonia sp.]
MKKLFTLFLVLLAFTACETESDFDENSQFQPEVQLLFSTDFFENIETNYPSLDKIAMNKSLIKYEENEQVLYSVDISNNTDLTIGKVDQDELFFTVVDNQVDKILIIESKTITGTNNVNFKLRNMVHQVFSEFTVTNTDKEAGVEWQIQTKGCFEDCISEAIEQCTENPIVVIGCTIANQFIIAGCALQCAADAIQR